MTQPLTRDLRVETARVRIAEELVLREADAGTFADVRGLLHAIGYETDAVCERMGTRPVRGFMVARETPLAAAVGDALDLAIHLFLLGEPAARSELGALLPPGAATLLESVGLLRGVPGDTTRCHAPAALYPTGGLYIVSDHARELVGVGWGEAATDVVFPALADTTVEFLSSLPATPCESLLDLGSGTGVAALHAAAGYARHAWAADITERATRMARFNVLLNGADNVTVVRGDLYEPVAGQTFDRIVSHPPYMPEPDPRLVFRDGGADGEQITRRIVAGLPAHLRPGGQLWCRCLGTDRRGAPLEGRLRAMLGAAAPDFDVVVVSSQAVTPAEYCGRILAMQGFTAASVDRQLTLFRELEVENIVVGLIVIERLAESRPAVTARRRLPRKERFTASAIDWLLRWERAASDPTLAARLTAARPVLQPEAEVQLRHHMREGELRAEGCAAITDFPFPFSFESTPGAALLLASCDGTRTVAELHAEMTRLGTVPAGITLEQFVPLIRTLAGGGVLELDGFPLPRPEGGPRAHPAGS